MSLKNATQHHPVVSIEEISSSFKLTPPIQLLSKQQQVSGQVVLPLITQVSEKGVYRLTLEEVELLSDNTYLCLPDFRGDRAFLRLKAGQWSLNLISWQLEKLDTDGDFREVASIWLHEGPISIQVKASEQTPLHLSFQTRSGVVSFSTLESDFNSTVTPPPPNEGWEDIWYGDALFTDTAAMLGFSRRYRQVTGNVILKGEGIADLKHLWELEKVGGLILLNTHIKELYLPNLRTAGEISIQNNPLLEWIHLPELSHLESGLKITDNHTLQVMDLPTLRHNDGDCYVGRNPHLNNISLEQLESTPGEFIVIDNTSLEGIWAPHLKTIGHLSVIHNTTMVKLSMSSLTSIGFQTPSMDEAGSLNITNNPTLFQIELDQLQNIKGNLLIRGNEALFHVGPFPSLQSIGEDLLICRNDSLMDVEGLETLRRIEGDLQIVDNPTLPMPLAEGFAEKHKNRSIGGTFLIEGNNDSWFFTAIQQIKSLIKGEGLR